MKHITAQVFEEYFNSIKVQHPSILNLNDVTLYNIKELLDKKIRNVGTSNYIQVVSFALFFIVSFIFITIYFFKSFVLMQPNFSTVFNQNNFLSSHVEINLATIFLITGIIIYTILLPALSRYFPEFINKSDSLMHLTGNLDISMPKYVGFTLFMNYLVTFVFLIYCYSYGLFPIWVLDIVMLFWLMAPIFILAIFPTVIIILFWFLIFNINDKPSGSTPLNIIILLVSLIKKLDDAEEFTISQNCFKKSLVEHIILISDLMKNMYQKISSGDIPSQWAIGQMERAAINFMSLATCVYYPKYNTLESLRNQLCIYLNIFLSGNYQELPCKDLKQFDDFSFNQKRSKVQKIIILFSFFAYMAFPIVVMAILEILFQINILPFIQSLLTVLYIIWGITGLIYFSDFLTSDTKDMLINITKLIIRRE
ncbi:MAG: hypothetical protein KAH86_04330 [Methanosarcinales archaeon]|nr:hypothetical protein [Methanosarcinales archaeon]